MQYDDFEVDKRCRTGDADVFFGAAGLHHLRLKELTRRAFRSVTEEVMGMACGRADPEIRETDEIPS